MKGKIYIEHEMVILKVTITNRQIHLKLLIIPEICPNIVDLYKMYQFNGNVTFLQLELLHCSMKSCVLKNSKNQLFDKILCTT